MNFRQIFCNSICLSIFALGLSSCDAGNPPARLIIFGDSISQGTRSNLPYAHLLADLCGFEPHNFSVSATRLEMDEQIGQIRRAQLLPDDVIFFSPGINDAGDRQRDPKYLKKYRQLLAEALRKFESAGAKAYLGTPLLVLPNTGIRYPYTPAELAEINTNAGLYADILKALIVEGKYQNIHLVDAREQFRPGLALMHDPVHPNRWGELRLYEIFRSAMGDTCQPSFLSEWKMRIYLQYIRFRLFLKPWKAKFLGAG